MNAMLCALVLGTGAAFLPPSARAQGSITTYNPHALRGCNDNSIAPDLIIDRCSRLLQSNAHLTNDSLALALNSRGAAYIDKSEYDSALTDLTRAAAIAPNEQTVFVNLGTVYLSKRQYDQALSSYDRAVHLEPDDWRALSGRCSAFYALDRYADAVRDCSRAIGINSRQSDLFYTRGAAYLAVGDDRHGLADMQRAHWLSPQSPIAMLGLAGAYEHTGDFERAIALSDQAAATAGQPDAHHPANPAMMTAAASSRCLSRAEANRDLQNAIEFCNEAVTRDPEDFDARESRGLTHLQLAANQDAWDDFDAAVGHDPEDSWALYGRGIAALRLGRVDEGHADLATAIAHEGNIAETYQRYGIAAN